LPKRKAQPRLTASNPIVWERSSSYGVTPSPLDQRRRVHAIAEVEQYALDDADLAEMTHLMRAVYTERNVLSFLKEFGEPFKENFGGVFVEQVISLAAGLRLAHALGSLLIDKEADLKGVVDCSAADPLMNSVNRLTVQSSAAPIRKYLDAVVKVWAGLETSSNKRARTVDRRGEIGPTAL
jgi:hypothetical protein